MFFSKKASCRLLLVCFFLSGCHNKNGEQTTFKAEAPEDPDDVKKFGYGSIWPGKNEFFAPLAKKKTQPSSSQPTNTGELREETWKAIQLALQSFGAIIDYSNKDTGDIRTQEDYIPEFSSSNKYKIEINMSKDGEVTVKVLAKNESRQILSQHEQKILSRIISFMRKTQN